jgi:hypothetical protein
MSEQTRKMKTDKDTWKIIPTRTIEASTIIFESLRAVIGTVSDTQTDGMNRADFIQSLQNHVGNSVAFFSLTFLTVTHPNMVSGISESSRLSIQNPSETSERPNLQMQ